jgi:sulfate permease, SulP family
VAARRSRCRIAVTALIVPKDLGYAGIAGVPLQNGPYAAAAGAVIYALFCTSRQISTGPSSSLAAVAGGAVVAAGIAGDQAAALVAAIAIVTGCCVSRLRCCGWDGSRFLSKAVVTGFLAGAAIDVVVGELSKLTGTDAEGENAPDRRAHQRLRACGTRPRLMPLSRSCRRG